ncbi:phenylacetate--CoA ligase [Alkalibacter rhizosphaerae]|uniref:Phenylacetate-coenzyme A ligase n=1 Tax=Alkalibacter rhizosphaerae TaxID=2815577 RepID=A0A975AI43_9FIRM|nr:phenylacetate--CoA ligase [Alkalibacter rhizosphaerae]QSX09082.1 phenylacetate--CoA ligase [Alkalibacter rhizosphaerae]
MIWSSLETLTRKEMESLQLEKLKHTVNRMYQNVEYFRNKMDHLHCKPEDIQSLEDIQRLPFSTKEDLRVNYPYGLFAVSRKEVVRIHASSGTTGKPTVVGYTKNDLKWWSQLIARLVSMAGATAEDTVQIAFKYGLFTGAFGLHYGLEELGAAVVPMSSGNTEKQLLLMKDFGTTALVSTPSYALHMGEVAQSMGMDPSKDLQVRLGLFGGEGSSEAMREKIQEIWGMLATENYGLSELIGPGVSGECSHLTGMHINEDFFYPEIIDPKTGEVLPPGEQGELVITTLQKEALPLIRYRTRDITRLTYEPCSCGRTTTRMEKISGRSDDMLVVKGVNLFPTQVEEVLRKFPALGPHYEITVEKVHHLDSLEIRVELNENLTLDSYQEFEKLEKGIRYELRIMLGLDAKISIVNPRTLQRFEGKAKRVFDLR